MRVVVTNDDGIRSRGLDVLATAAAARGWDVVVVAPSSDRSGSSAAIGRLAKDEPLELLPADRSVDGAHEAFVVDGPPGLAALLACRGGLGPAPDLVLSGVNAGPNTGHAILHSGTVGAALTAASFGVSALAVSLEVSEPMSWGTVARWFDEAVEVLLDARAPVVLNLNVPARAPDAIRGLRWARLDRFGAVRVAVAERRGTMLQVEYRSTGLDLEPESDTALVANGYATLTAIEGIGELPRHRLRGYRPEQPPAERVTAVPASAHDNSTRPASSRDGG
jgi:5'-nucleotidase